MTRLAAIFCFTLALLPASAAAGAFSAHEQGTGTTWLGVSALQFGYKEFDDGGKLLDREDGILPGLRIGADVQQGSMLFSIDFTYNAGTVDYDGQLQDGTPHKTLTNEKVSDLSASLGKRFGEQTVLYMGVGYRQWDRDIQASGGVSGLFERYAWPYAMLGGEQRLWQNGEHRLSLNGYVTYPINPVMTLQLAGYNDVTLDLGGKPGFRLIVPWRTRLASRLQLEVAPYYEYWQLGRSPDVIVGNWIIHEPRSETGNVGVAVSIGF